MIKSRRVVGMAVLSMALLSTACTTVTRTALTTRPAGGEPSAGSPGSDAAAPSDTVASNGSPGAGGQAVTGGSAASAAKTATGRQAGAATPAGAQSATSPTGAKKCSTPVKIGISYSSDMGAAVTALSNPTEGSDIQAYANQLKALYQTMADWINANGGLGADGCPVAIVYHDFHTLGSDGYGGESQAECIDFTEDQHVFAIIPMAVENRVLITCAAQHHTPVLWEYCGCEYIPDQADFSEYRGYIYSPDGIAAHRFAPFIPIWKQGGLFGPGSKVGVLIGDDGSGSAQYAASTWKPQLEAMGIEPVEFTYTRPQSIADNDQTMSQFQSAILAFKTAGVNQVLFSVGVEGASLFPSAAAAQNYYPAWGLSSATNIDTPVLYPDSEQGKVVGASYYYQDVWSNEGQLASNPPSDARNTCNGIYKNKTGSLPLSQAYWICDDFFFLRSGLRGTSFLTPQTLLAGIDGLGAAGQSSANSYGAEHFSSPAGYDGAKSARAVVWDKANQTYNYAGPVQPVP